jgi:hypothetical protein
MCDTSKTPAPLRVPRCSETIEEYWTGIDQPAKSTIRPLLFSCHSARGVRCGIYFMNPFGTDEGTTGQLYRPFSNLIVRVLTKATSLTGFYAVLISFA